MNGWSIEGNEERYNNAVEIIDTYRRSRPVYSSYEKALEEQIKELKKENRKLKKELKNLKKGIDKSDRI